MITHERLTEMLHEEMDKFTKIGMTFIRTPYIDKVFPKATSFYADAWRQLGKIRVSYYFLDAPEIEIRATLAHELCHLVLEAGHGHGSEWQKVAARFCKAYPAYDIKRCGSNIAGHTHDYNLRANVIAPKPRTKYIITCPVCGAQWAYTRRSRLLDCLSQGKCPYCKHVGLTRLK